MNDNQDYEDTLDSEIDDWLAADLDHYEEQQENDIQLFREYIRNPLIKTAFAAKPYQGNLLEIVDMDLQDQADSTNGACVYDENHVLVGLIHMIPSYLNQDEPGGEFSHNKFSNRSSMIQRYPSGEILGTFTVSDELRTSSIEVLQEGTRLENAAVAFHWGPKAYVMPGIHVSLGRRTMNTSLQIELQPIARTEQEFRDANKSWKL